MSEEKKPFLTINKEYDEIQINIKHTKPYIDLQQENQQLKAELEMYENGVYYSSENDKLKEVIDEVREYVDKMFNNEPSNSREYDYYCEKLLQILDKVKENKNENR